jgi:hypothetical protein
MVSVVSSLTGAVFGGDLVLGGALRCSSALGE